MLFSSLMITEEEAEEICARGPALQTSQSCPAGASLVPVGPFLVFQKGKRKVFFLSELAPERKEGEETV